MNVLSLFDGMSCGQIALNQLGYDVDKYYAAEIDKYAIQVTQKNYPDTIQLGSVIEWRSWDIDWSSIDLVSGGFPCQAWSVAGKQLGDRDERGKLFWVMLDIMQNVLFFNPNAKFLMENVKMKSEFESYITHHTQEALGHVNKILINSALVSAQSRQRYYWTNIECIEQPEDRGIVLKDVLEDGQVDREKSYCIDANYFKGGNLNQYFNKSRRQVVFSEEVKTGPCELREYRKTALCHQAATALDLEGHDINKRVYKDTGKSPTLNTVTKPNILIGDGVLTIKEATKKGYTEIQDGDCFDATFPNSKTRRGRNMKDKSNCLTAANYDYMRYEHPTYRKLTPLECERLQTVPDGYTEGVSNTQRYKMLGNGWTVEVIKHIYKNIPHT